MAMESTSVYWIPVYQILESRGIEVCLVNAQHVKNVPGRKTDVSDCQWLQYLPFGGSVAGQFPSSRLPLRDSLSLETPQQSDPDGGRACAAHAESA